VGPSACCERLPLTTNGLMSQSMGTSELAVPLNLMSEQFIITLSDGMVTQGVLL
jgi:hypothetical protein